MSRQVICQVDGQPSSACDMSNKPETTAPCNQQPCIKTTWNFGDWSQVSYLESTPEWYCVKFK